MRDLPNLDALRALAVLLVFMDHVLETYYPEFRDVNHFAHYLGRLGVLLFFVHTARVLMSSLDRVGSTKAFYIRRVFRIYPLAIVCILLAVAFGIPQVPWRTYEPQGWFDLTSNLLLTQNLTGSEPVIGPLWSLPVELQMYAVLPLVYALRKHIWLIFGASILGAAFIAPLSDSLGVIKYAPCFVAGVVAYTTELKDNPLKGWPVFLLCIVALYVAIEMVTPGIHHLALQVAVCIAVGFAIPKFDQSKSVLLNRTTHLIAKYSYGIYLFHCAALWIAPNVFVAVLITAAMSVASFHLIENPMIRLGSKIAARQPVMVERAK